MIIAFDGQKLKRKREEKGITQLSFAEMLNVSPSLISKIERGKKVPSVTLAYLMAYQLDSDIHDFIKKEE